MKILKGFVQGVVEKGTAEKPWALVAIDDITTNFNGFNETKVVEFMVAGKDFKNGIHNAYRAQIGAEVFAPYNDEIDTYNGKSRIRYMLSGSPLRLQEAAPVQQSRPAVASTQTAAPRQQANG